MMMAIEHVNIGRMAGSCKKIIVNVPGVLHSPDITLMYKVSLVSLVQCYISFDHERLALLCVSQLYK